MTNLHSLFRKIVFFRFPCMKVALLPPNASKKSSPLFLRVIISLKPFWIQLSYFVVLSSLGYLALKMLEPKNASFKPKDLDVFFMAVSAMTVSSMLALDMEIFSNAQLLVFTLLMFLGGEVFVSMLGLHFRKLKFSLDESNSDHSLERSIELGVNLNESKPFPSKPCDQESLKYKNGIRSLAYVILCYLILVHFIGFIFTYAYMGLTPSARSVLTSKGLSRTTFTLFTVVSTFANCGFLPTNENMVVFQKNSGLILILIPQILLGNTLYPVALWLVILTLAKITKRNEFDYMLTNFKDMRYSHLLSGLRCFYLAATVVGFTLIQLTVFCCVEWHNKELTGGLNAYEKLVASLFQVVNTRHSGEAVLDLTKISAVTVVGFVVMMYLPPLTTFFPVDESISEDDEKSHHRQDQKKSFVEYLLLSDLSYLAIFTIAVCLTESRKLDTDPINFSVRNIVFEIVSAYGNVGLSTSYSCGKQIKNDGNCKDAWYGFVGRWSNDGKIMLILVMFVGRLKKFNRKGGRHWKLS